MILENEFTVAASPEDVYALLIDVERVAPCLPGTEILDRREDGSYEGQMNLRLGPMKLKYKGSVSIVEQDPAAWSATMLASGTDAKGQGTAQGTLRMGVAATEAGATVTVATELKVTGRVAQMGQGIMRDVSMRMMDDMAQNMERLLVTPDVADVESSSVLSGTDGASSPVAPGPAPAPPAAASSVSLGTILGAVVRGRWAALRAWFRSRSGRGAHGG